MSDGVYLTIQGDTWDVIAKKVYGNEEQLSLLMQGNLPLLDYAVFPAGIRVRIPDKPADQTITSIDWRD